ncbi:MAG TPA: siderophore-interacting protein [Propionicimonas sp.]|uniref:siderophore-interacting protein n=1 Tax=Propionicimonas sp. TaxID=1955623 RepID=UPI002F426572
MTTTATVGFQTVPLESTLRSASLLSRTWLTPAYVRVRLSGPELRGFTAPGADDHVRLFLAPPGSSAPPTPEQWREFDSREYTPVSHDPEAGWVDFDFLVHAVGTGSEWASNARLGSVCAIGGPRRSNAIAGEPDALFLAGDETAIPAITRFLRQRKPGLPARVLVEVSQDNVQVPLPIDDATDLTVLVRPGELLTETLAGLAAADRPAGNVLAFVAAESAVVPVARGLLQNRWDIPSDAVIVKGYWRQD